MNIPFSFIERLLFKSRLTTDSIADYQNVESATASAPPMATAVPIGKVTVSPSPDVGGIELGRHPISLGPCPHCNQSTATRIKTYPSWETWLAAGLLVLVFWPICWIPLVTDSVSYHLLALENCLRINSLILLPIQWQV